MNENISKSQMSSHQKSAAEIAKPEPKKVYYTYSMPKQEDAFPRIGQGLLPNLTRNQKL